MARVSRRGARLASQGLVPGQVVLVPDAPVLDLLVMQHALPRLGCGIFPVSSRYGEGRRAALAEAAGVEWHWRLGAGRGMLEPTGLATRMPGEPRVRASLILETSGSEGRPKAVMLTRGNLIDSATTVARRLGLGVGDRWLSCLPGNHVGGLMIGYRCAESGATALLHERFDASAVARALQQERVTHVSLVPPMLARLLGAADGPPPHLRVLLVGGQSLSSSLAHRAIQAGWPLHVTYGMTETASQVATSDVLSAVPEPGYAGPLLPGLQVRCGGSRAFPGPIRIRGSMVMAGYANPERRPGEGLEDGWLPTKDVGYLNGGRELFVLGRADDVLVVGGEQVLPVQIEGKMMAAPGLASVALVPVPDPDWGHSLVAVYTGPIGQPALQQWCRAHLLRRECPRAFLPIDDLPLLDGLKPDRRRIRGMVARWLARGGGNPILR